MTAPTTTQDIGNALPGGTISGTVGLVTVTDDTASTADWTATALATDWTNGTTPIPATDVSYATGTPAVVSGTVTPTGSTITLSNTAQDVVTTTGVSGDNSVTWTPTLSLTVPPSATGGLYTATLTQDVS